MNCARVNCARVFINCPVQLRSPSLPGLRFKDVMIPAVKKHYRGKGIKKFYICCDGATAFNNLDKARTVE